VSHKTGFIKVEKILIPVGLASGIHEPTSKSHLNNQSLGFEKLVSFGDRKGLSATQLKVYLNTQKSLGDTLQGMERGGILKGLGSGLRKKYFLA
jgi:hypothetical protein